MLEYAFSKKSDTNLLLMETQLEEDESFWNDQSNKEMFTNSIRNIRRPAPTRKDAIKKRALKQRVLKKENDDDGGGNEDEDDTVTEAAPPKKLPTGTGVWGI